MSPPGSCFRTLRTCRTCLSAVRRRTPAFGLPTGHAQHVIQRQASTLPEVVGQSGRRYRIKRLLQEKTSPPGRVYLATVQDQKFILKDVSQSDFKYYEDMHRSLGSCPYLRLLQDTVPEPSMFVYQCFTDHLLNLVQKDLPIALTKRILKDTLRGLAALHDQNIVHNDVKPNNVLVQRYERNGKTIIEQVQLGDIEDAAYVPPGSDIVGRQAGNWMWRSPEAHARAPVNKPSDIFSFGAVCIYAVHKRIIFAVGKEELAEGEDRLSHVLERQISYFADMDGMNAFLKHLGDSPWCQIFEVLRDGFNESNPRKPFSLWKGVKPDFKDLICGLMNIDPARRLTAHEALAHKWFRDV